MKNISILAPCRKQDNGIPQSYLRELLTIGHNVKIYNTLNDDQPGISQLDSRAWTEQGLKQLIHEARAGIFIPNIILHLDFGLFKSNLLNKKEFPSAIWIYESGDDPQCFHYNFQKVKNGNFDLVMSPDIRAVNAYNNNGFKAVWSPHFADPLFLGEEIEPIYDAITSRHFSEPFFVELKGRLGERFCARDQFINEKDHLQFLKQGKMVIQNSKYKEITRRIFEGMLANRLVITDRPDPATKIDLIFKEDEEIIYFDTVEECVEKINYFSKNKKERNLIAKNGYKKVSKNHTIQKRIQQLLKVIQCSN